MKIAVDLRTAGGERAGKGHFTFNIVRSLLMEDKKNEYILYSKNGIAGFSQFTNAKVKIIKGYGIIWHLKVLKDIKKEKVGIFFAPSSFIIPSLLPKTIKSIVAVHDLVAFLFPETHNGKAVFIERLLLKRAVLRATRIVTVSENTKCDFINKFNIDKGKIDVIYCSASENYKPVGKKTLIDFVKDTDLPSKFFLAVGTIIPRKNYDRLVDAYIKLHKDSPQYHLIIVGGKGWGNTKILEKIKKNHLKNKIHLLGYLSDKSLVNLYNLATALVFPSYYEGFGIPPLEAMNCGCPVIASNCSSIPEVVGDAAIMVNPNSSDDIADAMYRIIKHSGLSEDLVKKGFLQAKKFSWNSSAKKLAVLIDQMS